MTVDKTSKIKRIHFQETISTKTNGSHIHNLNEIMGDNFY